MSAAVMRRTTGSTLPEIDVIGIPPFFVWSIGAGAGRPCVDLDQN
jgi:hypothetical protein